MATKGRTVAGLTISKADADRINAWKRRNKQTTPSLAALIGAKPENLKKALDGTVRLNPEAYQKLMQVISKE